MFDTDRPGVPDADMDVTDGDEAPPSADPNPPQAVPAGEADAPGRPADAVHADPELPPKFMPPEGGDPFSFRVDRTDVPVPGARVIDGTLVMPRESWDQHIQSKWVANRAEWTRREQDYQQKVRSLEQVIPQERQQVKAQVDQLAEMLDGTPEGRERLIAWLDGYEQNAPILKLQAELRIKQEKLERFEREQADLETTRHADELRPRLVGHVNEMVAAAQQEFPALAGRQDLAEHIFKYFAPRLFYDDPNGPYQAPDGTRFNFATELFRDIMQDEAKRAQVQVQNTVKVAEVVKKNAAAVGQPRTATGQFVKPPPPKEAGPRRLTAQEWEDRYADKKFS
jgi:hypothetical protein